MTETDPRHIIALKTYGSQRKTRQGKRMSALKIGSMNAIPQILLSLIPGTRDISSSRDSYVYIHVPNKPDLRRNWLFVDLSDDELRQVETITMQHSVNRGVMRWRNHTWEYLPCKLTPQYETPDHGADTPPGSPAGYRSLRSDGRTGASGGADDPDTIFADYSKLSDHKPAWWWIPANDATYRNKGALRGASCGWSRKRYAFFYKGDNLPDALLKLLDNADECRAIMDGMTPEEARQRFRYGNAAGEDTDPCSVDEAAQMLGGTVRDDPPSLYTRGETAWTTRPLAAGIDGRDEPVPEHTRFTVTDIDFAETPQNPVYSIRYGHDNRIVRVTQEDLLPPRQFALDDTVYNRAWIETADGERIRPGSAGHIVKLYRYNPRAGELSGYSYDVEWPDHGVEWVLEQELDGDKPKSRFYTGSSAISDTRQAALHASDDEKLAAIDGEAPEMPGCHCETTAEPAGWLPAENLDTRVACAICNPDGLRVPIANPEDPDAEQPPAIRLIKAQRLDDHDDKDDPIRRAIREAEPSPRQTTSSQAVRRDRTQKIPAELAGEMAGSVWCYGYATDAGTLVYLNIGGPRSGIEAVRGKLGNAIPVNLLPEDAPAIELTPGENQKGTYTAILSNIREARFMHCILIHDRITAPDYSVKATTYILQVDERQAKGQMLHHVRQTVNVPVFEVWTDYLWRAGQTAMLIRNCRTSNSLIVKAVSLDKTAWRRLITGGLAGGIITLPE